MKLPLDARQLRRAGAKQPHRAGARCLDVCEAVGCCVRGLPSDARTLLGALKIFVAVAHMR
jgi:hypothetical protein